MCEGESVTCMRCFVRVSVLAAFYSSLKNVALRVLSNAPIAAIHSPSVVNMPRYVFFLFSKFIVPSIICARFHVSSSSESFVHEREDRVRVSRGRSGSLTLSLNISLLLFVFLQFQLCSISSRLAHFRVFQKCVF